MGSFTVIQSELLLAPGVIQGETDGDCLKMQVSRWARQMICTKGWSLLISQSYTQTSGAKDSRPLLFQHHRIHDALLEICLNDRPTVFKHSFSTFIFFYNFISNTSYSPKV